MKKIPSPKTEHWFFRNTSRFLKSPPHYFADMKVECGDIFYLGLARRKLIGITHPDYAKQVLVTNNRNYIKDVPTKKMSIALGNGLLTNDGDSWRKHRRIAQPAFHKKKLEKMAQVMIDCTAEMLDQWERQEDMMDVAAEMTRVTSDIVAKTLFGADLDNLDELAEAIHHNNAFMTYYFRALFPWPLWVPTKRNRIFLHYQRTIDTMIFNLIDQRRKESVERDDLLSMLMDARDEETGDGMSKQQLRDEAATLYAAGHETSANGLSWTLYHLSRHPEIYEKLRQEVHQVLGDRSPTVADVPRLGYTRQILEESMRLLPPAWVVGREAIEEDEIDGYPIPKGYQVIIPMWVIHRHPDFWETPEKFDPDRFLPEKVKNRHKYSYFPFGGGPRLCIGSHFAMMEMQIVLAMIAQRFKPVLDPNHPVELHPLVTLRPKHGIRMKMELSPLTTPAY